ncbi:MAG: polyphosphate polymerase domain-containing protein, partial [Phycisphaerales bacterium]
GGGRGGRPGPGGDRPGDHLSPSLRSRGQGTPATELKFLVGRAVGEAVASWAAQTLTPDPHGGLAGLYQTTTLALDTPGLDVFHRTPGYTGCKYRVRRYGSNDWVFLECKRKSGDRVSKERVTLPHDRLEAAMRDPESHSDGGSLGRAVIDAGLRPSAMIAYARRAFFANTPEGPIRLTVDHDLRGSSADSWNVLAPTPGTLLEPERFIVEMKFVDTLPTLLRGLVAELGLNPRSLSKYRLCRERLNGGAHG